MLNWSKNTLTLSYEKYPCYINIPPKKYFYFMKLANEVFSLLEIRNSIYKSLTLKNISRREWLQKCNNKIDQINKNRKEATLDQLNLVATKFNKCSTFSRQALPFKLMERHRLIPKLCVVHLCYGVTVDERANIFLIFSLWKRIYIDGETSMKNEVAH